MSKNRTAGSKSGHPDTHRPLKPWPPAMSRRTFWLLAMVPLLVLVAMSARGLNRPFEGLHAWAQADSAWFTRNHVRYGLGYTHGVKTMALGNPPPAHPKRYYDHPQYGGLIPAAVMWVFGMNRWSVRLGLLLADLGVLLLLMGMLRRFVGEWQSLLSGLILAMVPISAYFGLGGYLIVASLGAFWMYLIIAGFMPDKQARWWHYVVMAVLLFSCLQMSWSGFFFAATIGFHYVVTCIARKDWTWIGATTVVLLAIIPVAVLTHLTALLFPAALVAYLACLAVVVVTKRTLPKWPICAGLLAAVVSCVVLRETFWAWLIYPTAVCLFYVLMRVFSRMWDRLALPIVFVGAPAAGAIMVFTIMLHGFNWNYHRIIELYKWRAAEGEMAGRIPTA